MTTEAELGVLREPRWWGNKRWRRPPDLKCPKCFSPLRLVRHKPVARWHCRACGASYLLQPVPVLVFSATLEWRAIDADLRVMVKHEPMGQVELARRLSVGVDTVVKHVRARSSGLHLFDQRVYTGTAREWGHYA